MRLFNPNQGHSPRRRLGADFSNPHHNKGAPTIQADPTVDLASSNQDQSVPRPHRKRRNLNNVAVFTHLSGPRQLRSGAVRVEIFESGYEGSLGDRPLSARSCQSRQASFDPLRTVTNTAVKPFYGTFYAPHSVSNRIISFS